MSPSSYSRKGYVPPNPIGSGQVSGPRCRIWWDTSVEAYRISTPYNEQFIDAIKQLIPGGARAYDPDTKIWLFDEKYFGPVEQLAKAIWPSQGEVDIKTKAATQQQTAAAPVTQQKLPDICEQFLKLIPYEAAQSAFRKAAMLLHPDRGGDQERMARINVLWNKLEKELYNK